MSRRLFTATGARALGLCVGLVGPWLAGVMSAAAGVVPLNPAGAGARFSPRASEAITPVESFLKSDQSTAVVGTEPSTIFMGDHLSLTGWGPAVPVVTSSPGQELAVSPSNPFSSRSSLPAAKQNVNSIPALPSLWSGFTSLIAILALGSCKRLQRALR